MPLPPICPPNRIQSPLWVYIPTHLFALVLPYHFCPFRLLSDFPFATRPIHFKNLPPPNSLRAARSERKHHRPPDTQVCGARERVLRPAIIGICGCAPSGAGGEGFLWTVREGTRRGCTSTEGGHRRRKRFLDLSRSRRRANS